MRLFPTNKPTYAPVRSYGTVKLDREPGNVWEWLCFYFSSVEVPTAHPRVSKSWMNEGATPWRHGRGVALRVGSNLLSLGAWKKGKTPVEQPHDFTGAPITVERIEREFNSAFE